jgi:hypothetical protein
MHVLQLCGDLSEAAACWHATAAVEVLLVLLMVLLLLLLHTAGRCLHVACCSSKLRGSVLEAGGCSGFAHDVDQGTLGFAVRQKQNNPCATSA